MSNNIHYISIKNNEIISSDLILNSIKQNKIIFIYKKPKNLKRIFKTIKFDGPAIILESSGSSNRSKICIHPIDNLNKSAYSSGIWLKSQGFNLCDCMIFNTLPLHHISGFMPLWRSQCWGSEYINISPNLIKRTKDLIDFSFSKKNIKSKKLITSLVPTQLFRLLNDKYGLIWLKIFDLIWVGGAQLSNNLFEKCRKEKINLAPCYGATETAAMISSLKPREFLNGYKNYGRILKDINLRINNDGIIEVSTERIGYELKSSHEIECFANQNGWWESGDYGKLVKENNFYYLEVLGRKDNAFDSGGETVFPDLIKTRIYEFIFYRKMPIKNLLIRKKVDTLWGNRFEIIIDFEDYLNQTEIKDLIHLLEEFTNNWPSHEKPMRWLIAKEKSIFDVNKTRIWKNTY